MAVQGQVSYKGAAIEEGAIQFFSTNASAGDATGAMITKGRYTIDALHGLTPGRYAVRISAPDYKGKRPDPEKMPGGPAVAAEKLPEKYNQKTKLTIEVSADASRNTHDFLLD